MARPIKNKWQIEIACFLYQNFTNDDDAIKKLNSNLNLSQNNDVENLIQWLRKWGCRQFDKDHEKLAIKELKKWYKKYVNKLPKKKDKLWNSNRQDLESCIELFDSLSNSQAGKRGKSDIHIGPVGAAKILFALRPNMFAPWDNPIYKEFGYSGDGESYISYLINIKNELTQIKKILKCSSYDDIPKKLRRDISSPPKILDEYYWVTITKGLKISEFEKMCKLSK